MEEKRDQLVLQVLMSLGVMSEPAFKNLYIDATTQCNLPPPAAAITADSIATSLTTKLRFASMEVRRGRAEDTGEWYVGLIDLRADDISVMACKYTPVEATFFKKILEKIVLGDGIDVPVKRRGIVTLNSLLKMADRKLDQGAVGQLVERLVSDMWLWKVQQPLIALLHCSFIALTRLLLLPQRGQRVGLGVRSILELTPYIEAVYEEGGGEGEREGGTLVSCMICLEKVFLGEGCPQPRCAAKLHRHCFETYRQGRPAPPCPHCQQPWARGQAGEGEQDA